MKKKFKNTLKTLVLMAMVSIMVIGCFSSTYAGNYHDTDYFIITRADGSDSIIPYVREKQDYTSSYIYNNKSECGVRVCVLGLNSASLNYWTDCSVKSYDPVALGQWKYLPNWVKERGYKYCTLKLTADYHRSLRLEGLWSPDSI